MFKFNIGRWAVLVLVLVGVVSAGNIARQAKTDRVQAEAAIAALPSAERKEPAAPAKHVEKTGHGESYGDAYTTDDVDPITGTHTFMMITRGIERGASIGIVHPDPDGDRTHVPRVGFAFSSFIRDNGNYGVATIEARFVMRDGSGAVVRTYNALMADGGKIAFITNSEQINDVAVLMSISSYVIARTDGFDGKTLIRVNSEPINWPESFAQKRMVLLDVAKGGA